MGELRDGKETYYEDYEPEDEKMKFAINDNKLTLTRDYNTEYAWSAVYIKQ